MKPVRKLSLAIALGMCLVPVLETRAQADEVTDLEKSLNQQHETLSTSDCTTACQALASIRRAADRICALEPGPRCVAAQAKAFEDTRKVRDACPQCAVAAVSPGMEPKPEAPAPPRSVETSQSVAAEHSRGGCASCASGGVAPSDLGVVGVGVLALVRLLRRKR